LLSLAQTLRRRVAADLKLREDELGLDADLADFGFDSFTGLKLINNVRDLFGLTLPAKTLFERATLRQMARFIAAHRGETETAAAAAPLAETPTRYPLSEGQKAIWFIHEMEPDNYAYNLPSAFRLRGALDPDALERAFHLVVARHPALRTVFTVEDGEPQAVELADSPPFFSRERWSGVDWATARERLQALAQEPFDLRDGPLLRVGLFELDAGWALLLTIHHVAFDGASFSHLTADLTACYEALARGETPALPAPQAHYSEFVAWQTATLASAAGERHWAYWRDKLAGDLPALALHTDRPRPPRQTYRGAVHPTTLPRPLAEKLRTFARAERSSLFMTLLAAFQLLLHRLSQQDDIVVGTPMAGRAQTRFENLVGYLMNMVAIRGDFSANPGFRGLLSQIQTAVLEALDHGDFPFPEIVKRLEVAREPNRTPIFQTVFIFQNWLQDVDQRVFRDEPAPPGALRMAPVAEVHETGGFDITVEILDAEDAMQVYFKYNPDLFTARRAASMAASYTALLESALAEPDKPVNYLSLVPDEQRRAALSVFAGHGTHPRGQTMHGLVEGWAARAPEAPAAVLDDGQTVARLTYGDLNRRANQLARFLTAQGVRPDTPVGVCMDRRPEMYVAIMGALKAGAAYVPLDPGYPAERLAVMAADAGAPWIVTRADLAARLPKTDARVIALDRDKAAIAAHGEGNLNLPMTPDQLAYVIFTSGSTGRPKGVMISHASLVNAYHAWEKAYRLSDCARSHLQMASFSFDVFSGDMARAFGSGAQLTICPRDFLLSPPDLYALMQRQRVDCAEFTPAVLRGLAAHVAEQGGDFSFMRLLIAGSDSWSVKEYAFFKSLCGPQTRLINSYGVTEATIDTTWHEGEAPPQAAALAAPGGTP